MSQHITVLLAAYNGVSYIEEQIRSILGQTLPPDQLLISDDGSTDGTVELLERLQAEYPSVLRLVAHKREGDYQDRWDQVPAPAMNFFWLLSQVSTKPGEYILLSDQDDVWLPEKIAHSVEAVKLAEAQSPNVPIALFGDARVVDDSLQQLHPSFQQMSGYHTDALDVAHLLMENKLIGCTMLFNRALRDKLTDTVPDGLRMHDWWIALIASAFGRIIYLDEPLLLYRQHTGNVVGGSSRSHYITNRVKHLTAQRQVLYDTCKQAEVFLTIYNDQLTETQKRLVSLFAGLPSANWFTRRYLILRYHFLKSGLLRNLGVLLII